jgi:hypothetical protein
MKTVLSVVLSIFASLNLIAQSERNETLISQLASIYHNDQVYRGLLRDIQNKYGGESKEMKDLFKKMFAADSLNLIKVEEILEEYCWLGTDVVGHEGNSTLFLVIQHAPQAAQEKYLPVMREAVAKGNAEAKSLALLEDRVALKQGRRQLYGSQISWDMKTNEYYVLPLDDPDNVDKRRAAMGLGPLADYVRHFRMTWDVEQYKKDLPSIQAKHKLQK